jgi:hypothetical protein
VVCGLTVTVQCEMSTEEDNPSPTVLNVPFGQDFAGCKGHSTVVAGKALEAKARVPHEGFC